MSSSPFFRQVALPFSALAFAVCWFYLTRELFLTVLRLRPLAAAGEPTAVLLIGLALPWALYLAQGLFYVPRRRSGTPPFIQPAEPAPLLFLPLPRRTALVDGPALELICTAGDRERLLALAEARFRLPLSARLALILQARSPLDRLLSLPVERSWPLISPLARLISLLLGPARQFLRCWAYLFFRLWRAGDDPGPLDQLSLYKQALACDLLDRAGEGASPDELRRLWRGLARIYDNPKYGYELGQSPPERPGPEPAAEEDPGRPWLAPRYRGVYLDLPATRAAGSLDELYDDGPEEGPDNFYPPELGREVELTARLAAERRRLARALAAGRAEGLIWLDGRLQAAWELEHSIWELDERLWQEKKRVAAHHRRCRSSHLAAAQRRGEGWPEALRAGLARLFLAERFEPERRDQALAALLKAEEEVYRPAAGRPRPPQDAPPDLPPDLGLGLPPPAPPEPPPRVYSASEQFNVGFGRGLLALIMLGLLFWQGSVLGRSRLIIHNGLDREMIVTLDGRRLNLGPFERLKLSIPPDHECSIKTSTADGQAVEAFQWRTAPIPGREVYNIAGAAPLMEWRAGAGNEGPSGRFLGRPRWLRTEAEVFFRDPEGPELEEGRLVLSGYGAEPPGLILAAFDREEDRAELVRLHARWDRPDSPWFWHWQILMSGRPEQAATLLDRLKHEPDFLEEGLKRFN